MRAEGLSLRGRLHRIECVGRGHRLGESDSDLGLSGRHHARARAAQDVKVGGTSVLVGDGRITRI